MWIGSESAACGGNFLPDPQNGLVSRMRILTLWPCVVVVLILLVVVMVVVVRGAWSIDILVVLAGSLAGGDACALANCVVLWTLFGRWRLAGLQACRLSEQPIRRESEVRCRVLRRVLISWLLLLNRLPSKPGTGEIRGNLRAESASRGRSGVALIFSLITHAMQHDATQSRLHLQPKGPSEGGLLRRLTAAHALFSLWPPSRHPSGSECEAMHPGAD